MVLRCNGRGQARRKAWSDGISAPASPRIAPDPRICPAAESRAIHPSLRQRPSDEAQSLSLFSQRETPVRPPAGTSVATAPQKICYCCQVLINQVTSGNKTERTQSRPLHLSSPFPRAHHYHIHCRIIPRDPPYPLRAGVPLAPARPPISQDTRISLASAHTHRRESESPTILSSSYVMFV